MHDAHPMGGREADERAAHHRQGLHRGERLPRAKHGTEGGAVDPFLDEVRSPVLLDQVVDPYDMLIVDAGKDLRLGP